LEEAGCQPLSTTVWNANAHFYDPLGFVSHESGTSVRVTADVESGKVILAIDERQYNFESWDASTERQEYSRDPKFKKLTKDWSCIVNLPQVHCEVYPSLSIGVDLADDQGDNGPERGGINNRSQCTLQPTDGGGIELFIDCCEIGEPWERLCAEVKREQRQREGRSSEDSGSESSEDEYSDSEIYEEGENGGNSKGVLSKIAEVGVEILSAIV
jgi:hypothetical protein